MTPEQEQQLRDLSMKVSQLTLEIEALKRDEVKEMNPSEFANGLSFIGRTSDTTATGALLINTPEGPKKILVAT